MNTKISVLIIPALMMAMAFSACNSQESKSIPKEKVSEQKAYQCPMKCEGEKLYDKPGKCPVCGMDLVEVKV